MRKIIFVATLLISGFYLSGCYYDNEEYLYPDTACDTSNVTYSVTIAGLMNDRGCNGCHNASGASGGIITDNYTDLNAAVQSGKLWGALNHESGFSPMPKNQSKLSDCDLTRIDIWIKAGSPDN